MPQVPNTTPQISLNVPGVQAPFTREFGKLGNAMENLGGTAEREGMDGMIQVKRAEAADAANNSHAQYLIDSDQKWQDLKLQSSDGYIHHGAVDPNDPASSIVQNPDGSRRTIVQEFHSWANDRYQSDQEKMPSELAAQTYRDRSLPYISDQLGKFNNEAQTMKVKFFDDNRELTRQKMGSVLAQNPGSLNPNSDGSYTVDLSNFYNYANSLHQNNASQIGIMHNGIQAQMKTKDDQKYIAHIDIQGAIPQILQAKKTGDQSRSSMVYGWLNALHGNDPQSQVRAKLGLPTLSSMMDPEQKTVEEQKLLGYLPVAKQMDFENYKHAIQATIQANELGKGDEGTFKEMLRQTAVFGQVDGGAHSAEAAEYAGKLYASKFTGMHSGPSYLGASNGQRAAWDEQGKAGAMASMAAWAKGLPAISYNKDLWSIAAHAVESKYLEVQQKVQSERKEDLADFAMKMRPEYGNQSVLPSGAKVSLSDYSRPLALNKTTGHAAYQEFSDQYNMMAKSAWSDHPEQYRAPITKEQSQTLGDTIQNVRIMNEQSRGQIPGQLAKFWGKDYQTNVEQMIKDKNLPANYRLMALHSKDSSDSQTFLMSCLGGGNDEDKNFKATLLASNPQAEESLRKAVDAVSNDYVNAATHGDINSNERLQNQNALRDTITVGAMKVLRQTGGTDYVAAAKQAYNRLVGNFGWVNQMGSQHFWQSGPSSPDFIPKVYNGKVIGENENATIVKNLNYDAQHIEQFHPGIPLMKTGQPDPDLDGQMSMMNKSTPYRYTVHGQMGHIFVYDDKNGVRRTVLQGDLKTPVFVPLDKSLQPRPELEKPGFFQNIIQKFDPSKFGSVPPSGRTINQINSQVGPTGRLLKTAPEIAAFNVMAEREGANLKGVRGVDEDSPQFKELHEALRSGSPLPSWLNENQRKMATQFRAHTK